MTTFLTVALVAVVVYAIYLRLKAIPSLKKTLESKDADITKLRHSNLSLSARVEDLEEDFRAKEAEALKLYGRLIRIVGRDKANEFKYKFKKIF